MQVTTLSTPVRPQFFPSASQAANSTATDSKKACTGCSSTITNTKLSVPAQSGRSTSRQAGSLPTSVRESSLAPHDFSSATVSSFLAMFGGSN